MTVASTTSPTESKWIRYQDYKLKIEAPEGWKIERDLYGMSIMVLGPEREDDRAVLSIQETSLKNFKFDYKQLNEIKNDYYVGRKNFIGEMDDAVYLNGLPIGLIKNKSGVEGFEIGFQYSAREMILEEKSIQLVCDDRLYLLKSLTNNKLPNEDKKVISTIVQNLDCKQVTLKDGPYEPSPLQDFAENFEKRTKQSFQWPTKEDIRNASDDAKVGIISSMVEFYKDFEEAAGAELYSKNQRNLSKLYSLFQDKSDKLAELVIQKAFAGEEYDCFFGGWPSKYVKSRNGYTCANPKDTNQNYQELQSDCGQNKLTCNPSLFGEGICIDLNNPEERSHATLKCEVGMKSKNRSFDDVVKSDKFDNQNLESTLSTARLVCNQEPYVSSNFGLCNTLKDKLSESIGRGKISKEESDNNFINGLDQMKPETFDQNVVSATNDFNDFEARCIDSKGELRADVEGCAEDLNSVLNQLETIDRLENKLSEEVEEQEYSEPIQNENCGNCEPNQPVVNESKKEKKATNANGQSCTKDQIKRKKERECTWNWKMLTSGASCALNTLTSIVKSLWGSIKAIAELAWDGVKWVGKKIVQGAKWFAGLFGYEDESSKKVTAASRTSNKAIEEFKKDPFSAAVNFFKEIYNSLADYVSKDVACEEWSGVPHMSTCLRPASSWECQPCLDRIDTVCSAVGVVAAEIVPAIFTGGASAALKGAALGAKVGSVVSRMGKLGKLVSLESKISKSLRIGGKYTNRYKNLSNSIKSSAKITGDLTKSQKILGKIYNASRWPSKKLKKIKNSLKVAKLNIAAFKSAKFGGLKSTIGKLKKIRDRFFVLRAGSWVVKKGVNITYRMVIKTPLKIAASPVTIPLKTAKGFINLQKKANVIGFKVADGMIDVGYKSTSWLGKKTINKTLVRPKMIHPYNPIVRDFASKVVTYGTIAKVPTRLKIAVDKTAEKAVFKFKTDDELRIEGKNMGLNLPDYKNYIRILYSGDEPTSSDKKTLEGIAAKQGYPVSMLVGLSVDVRLLEAATCNEVYFSEFDYQQYAEYQEISVQEVKKLIQEDLKKSKTDCGS